MSLVEVLIALGLLTVIVLSLAQVERYTARAASAARYLTLATELAADKVDQLRSLTWSVDAAGAAVSDLQTDLTSNPERPAGGTGLQPSPGGALDRDVAGYAEYLDAAGRSLGGAPAAPAGSAFVRRWSIAPLAASPSMALVLQVRVRALNSDGDVVTTALRTRVAR